MYQTWEFHLYPRDKENLPINQKVTMSHFRKGHFGFFSTFPHPANMKWNENVQWDRQYCKLCQTASSSPFFHDLSSVYYTLMHMDILLNARHFTLCTTFTVLAVGPKWSRSVMWHDRRNTNRCDEVFGSLRSRFGVALRSAGTVSIYCPTGQLMQGECFYSLFNERSSKQICFLHWQYIWIYLFIYSVLAHPLPRSTTGRHKLLFIRPNVYAYYIPLYILDK